MKRFVIAAAVVAILAVAAVLILRANAARGNGDAWNALLAASANPGDWVTYGGSFDEQRFSRLTAIDDANVDRLGLAWSFELDTNRAQETTPLEQDGVLYTTTAWSKLYAHDATSGELLWQYDPQVAPAVGTKGCCDVGNRGAAIYDGKIYMGVFDGRLVAIDANTGREVWSTVTVDQSQSYTITGAPRIVKGNVVIGNGGAELGVRGYVSAYDAQTGEMVWRFYTVPGNPADGPDGAASDPVLERLASDTWHGDFWEAGGGGTVWDSIVYDEALDQLYIGVGNGSPWNHRMRSDGKGDNLFLSSIVALDPDTGEYVWHYQGTPGESWDYTHTQTIILATLPIDGVERKVLMQAPKNGFFYVIDRETGKLLSAENYVEVNWASGYDMATGRPIENPEARYEQGSFTAFPGALGAHNWQPMAYSPATRLAYIPAQETPFTYEETDYYRYRHNRWNLGVDLSRGDQPEDPGQYKAIRAILKGRIIAWDPVAQKEAWRFEHGGPWNGGMLATAGNLVFQGDLTGTLRALSADSGEELWTFDIGMPVMGSPVTYEVGGVQYVAVVAGYGGAYALSGGFNDDPAPQPNGRLLVFALDASGVLPESAKFSLPPANPASDDFTAAQIAQGRRIYENQCFACHGAGGRSSGIIPDLRRSGALPSAATWKAVVIDGVLRDQGMVSFADTLSVAEAESVRAYVSRRAEVLQGNEKK